MTMKEMARVYRENNEPLKLRLRELRLAVRECRDDEERLRLKRRIADLTPIYREGRETAVLMERYYVRRRRHHGKTDQTGNYPA